MSRASRGSHVTDGGMAVTRTLDLLQKVTEENAKLHQQLLDLRSQSRGSQSYPEEVTIQGSI
jgi:hypothetical protein